MDEDIIEDGELPSPEELEAQAALIEHEQEIRAQVAAEQVNLADNLEEDVKKRIAKTVIEDARNDLDSRREWEEKQAHWSKLYYQTDFEPDGERAWAACESLPILTEACNMFATRTQKAFFSKPEFIGAQIIQYAEGQKLEQLRKRAERVGRHLNWQLTYKQRTYRSDKCALFLATAIAGSYFTKAYYDPIKRKNCVENVSADDLIVPYYVGPVAIEDLPRKTHVIRRPMSDARKLVDRGYFSQMPKKAQDLQLTAKQLAYDEAQGIQQSPGGSSNDEESGMFLALEQYRELDIDGEYKPYIVTVDKTSCTVVRISINYEATPTGAPTEEQEPYKAIEYFTHYKFLDNPDGFYGYGYGHLLGDINTACNVALRDSLDASFLQNSGNNSGFVSGELADDSEEVTLDIGRFKKLGTSIADIRQKVYTMQFPGPSAALVEIMQLLDQRGQRLGAVTEATTGSSERVQQPTTVITQVEQAMELLTSVQLGISRSMGDELQKLFRLNRLYMPAVEYFVVNDEPQQVAISDYSGDMLIEPVFDPRFSSSAQKLALAQAELQAVTSNPNSAMRPQVIDMAFKNYLEAIGSDKVEEYFPEPPVPQNIDDQEIENAFFLLPMGERPPFDVFADQNHAEHLAQLDAFIANYATNLDEQTLLQMQDHKRKHMAYQYMRENAGKSGDFPPAAPRYNPNIDLGQINMSMFGNGLSSTQQGEGGR